MLRAISSVVLGLAVMTVTSFAIEFAVDAAFLRLFPGAYPAREALAASTLVKALMFVYTAACAALGGWVTAAAAKRPAIKHAVALAAIQEVLTIIAWAEHIASAPAWVWIGSLVSVPPAIILGAYWRGRRRLAAVISTTAP